MLSSSTSQWEHGLPPQFAMSKVLYTDEFVKLTEDILIIKKFLFGTLRPKVIMLKDIRVVYFDEQSKKYAHKRIWGRAHHKSSDKSVYWAADFRRCLPKIEHANRSDVVVDLEDGLLKGFTVCDTQNFLSLIRLFAPISTIIVDNLDFA